VVSRAFVVGHQSPTRTVSRRRRMTLLLSFFAIFAFPLRSLRLKVFVFERAHEKKLITASSQRTAAKDAKKKPRVQEDCHYLGALTLPLPEITFVS
jgi:hypothetical protein